MFKTFLNSETASSSLLSLSSPVPLLLTLLPPTQLYGSPLAAVSNTGSSQGSGHIDYF